MGGAAENGEESECMRDGYRADHRGWLFNFFWPLTRYVITHLVVTTLGTLIFFVFNRTKVIGRSHVPRERNTLLLSNHQSMIDSFLLGMCAFYGPSLFKPYLVPWNLAAEENFYANWFVGWWADQCKCIPVRPGRRDLKALNRMVRALSSGTMILFPEGTRTRDGSVGKGRAGAGIVILQNQPVVVPVVIHGMNEVLPIGRVIPKIGKRVYVMFGEPFDYSDYLGRESSKETSEALVDEVMEKLRAQLAELRSRYRLQTEVGE